MINIEFPETNIVKCVFSLRQNSKYTGEAYDEYDHMRPHDLKKYIYRVPSILRGQLKVGDFVVVHCATGYQLCEIVELNVISNFDEKTLAPVVCKVDLSAYIDEVDRAAKLAVMKDGRVIETAADVREFFRRPQHPHSQALVAEARKMELE